MKANKDCIFCKIKKGKIPATKIYEDNSTIAFLDISPINKGHVLVMPKQHYETIIEIPESKLKKLILIIQKIAKAVEKMSDGINIIQNNKKSAGQIVPHLHFHIIPRFETDGFKFDWQNKTYEPNEIEVYAEKIKKLLESPEQQTQQPAQ